MTKTVVIATNNAHKVEEIETALNFEGWEFKSLKDAGLVSDPEESGTTFLENARIKARAAHELACAAVLADDSGLLLMLLMALQACIRLVTAASMEMIALTTPSCCVNLVLFRLAKRTARFASVLVFIDEDGLETVAEGFVEGHIGLVERGEHGFGYDPLFFPDVYNGEVTMAELTQSQKNAISHRGNALRELRKKLHPSD